MHTTYIATWENGMNMLLGKKHHETPDVAYLLLDAMLFHIITAEGPVTSTTLSNVDTKPSTTRSTF